MPSTLKIRINRARGLPVMDKSTKSTDAFVEVRLGSNIKRQTEVKKKTLNPIWDVDMRINCTDDSVVQNEPLEFRVMDEDIYSADDPIGYVHIDLNPLLMRAAHADEDKIDSNTSSKSRSAMKGGGSQVDMMNSSSVGSGDMVIDGWFPIYDTLKGIRGELQLSVKVQFIGDANPFKDSSAGVTFFSTSVLSSPDVDVKYVYGFVEELVVHDDPEYEFENKFRSPQKSNDSRLRLLYRLSCGLRRQLGKKVQEMGGNAVLAYTQTFDVEGDSGIVARACGTACKLFNTGGISNALTYNGTSPNIGSPPSSPASLRGRSNSFSPRGYGGFGMVSNNSGSSVGPPSPLSLTRKALVDDEDSKTSNDNKTNSNEKKKNSNNSPNSISPTESPSFFHGGINSFKRNARIQSSAWNFVNAKNLPSTSHMQDLSREVQLLTISNFKAKVRLRLAGVVSAQSVKYLGKLHAKISDRETRDAWWAELRDEIRSHARVLKCWFIVGYRETCTIMDDVCVLTATGTAAVVRREKRRKFKRNNYFTSSGRHNRHSNIPQTTTNSSPRNSFFGSTFSNNNSSGGSGNHVGSGGNSNGRRRASFGRVDFDKTVPGVSSSGGGGGLSPQRGSNSSIFRRVRFDPGCATCHIPYPHNSAPFANMRLVPCQSCKKRWVPEVLLATIECPPLLPTRGRGRLVQARACKIMSSSQTKVQKGEALALTVSEILPFLQFDLHRQLINKIKIMGMNAAFGVTTQIQLGPNILVGFVTATAVSLPALPSPPALRIQRNIKVVDAEDRALVSLQDQLQNLSIFNKQMVLEMPVTTRLSRKIFASFYQGSPKLSPKIYDSPKSSPSTIRLHRSLSAGEGTALLQNTQEDRSASNLNNNDNNNSGSREENEDKKPSNNINANNDIITAANSNSKNKKKDNVARSLFTQEQKVEAGNIKNNNGDESNSNMDGTKSKISTLEIGPPALSVNTNLSPPPSSDDTSSSSSSSNSNSSSSSSSSSDDDRQKENDDSSDEETANNASSNRKKMGSARSARRRRRRRRHYDDAREPFVLEVDDETDEDIMSVLMDHLPPPGISLVNTQYVPGCDNGAIGTLAEAVLVVQRIPLAKYLNRVKDARKNIELASIFKKLVKSLTFKIRQAAPCFVCNLNMWIGLPADGSMEIFATGHVLKEAPNQLVEISAARQHMVALKKSPAPCMFPNALALRVEHQSMEAFDKFEQGDHTSSIETDLFPLDEDVNLTMSNNPITMHNDRSLIITPLSFVPHKSIKKYVGRISLHFIRESWSVTDLGEFYHNFFVQVYDCCRAQVAANGGNALLSFRINPHESGGKLFRNQIYSLVSVSGDAVILE